MREQWEQVKEIVASALQLEGLERDEFVRDACGQDEDLLREVQSLVASHAEADSILECSPVAAFFPDSAPSMIGRQIGNYRIIAVTGQGGMATVYAAERADREFRKRVAIKIVRPGSNVEEILRRFRNERQTLAELDHPNIVRLIDGGTTSEGLPYLVMDFVEGLPLDEYCDQQRLSIPARLELFCTICSAVHYAHEHKVIHRDLKPHNILVSRDGSPKLLDFGIAKLIGPSIPELSATTLTAWRPMTPEYASPEQIRHQPITNASDVYSLGVLLYELLVGRKPFRSTPESWLAFEQMVCEQDPPMPSTVIEAVNGQDTADEVPARAPSQQAAARRTTPTELRRALRGDLDTIVMMALRKEPERRYTSAQELAEDIQRHLRGAAVMARRSTLAYRTGKFLRQHAESTMAIVILCALTTTLGLWQARRYQSLGASAESRSAVPGPSRRSVAVLGIKNLSNRRDTAWISTALSEMLATELAVGDSLRVIPGETVSRAKIELGLPDEETLSPETLQRVRGNLGTDLVVSGAYLDSGASDIRVDLHLQETANGETLYAVSVTGKESGLLELVSRSGTQLRAKLGAAGTSQFETSGVQAAYPSTTDAMRFYSQGLIKLRAFDALGARDLFVRAVATDPSFPLAHMALARAWQTLGYDVRAMEESKKAFELSEKLSRQDYLLVEARYFESLRDWDKAVETYRALFSFFPDNLGYGLSLASAQTSGGKGNDALVTLATLESASVQNREDPRIDLARAEAAASMGDNKLRRDAADRAANKAARDGAKLLVARARTLECRALANLGENQTAAAICEEGRRIYAEAGDRGGLARMLHAMAEIPLDQEDLPHAEALYREALSLTREIGDRQGIGRELGNLALIYKYRGEYETARTMTEDALRNEQAAGDKNGMIGQTGNMGSLFRLEGRLPDALHYYQQALVLSDELANKSSVALAMKNIGETLALRGDLNGALKNLQQALAIQRERGEKHYVAETLASLGEVYGWQGNTEKARSAFAEALSLQEQSNESGAIAATGLALGRLNCDSGRLKEAESLAFAAFQTFQTLKETDNQIAAGGLLARVLAEEGRASEARVQIATALQLSERSKNIPVLLPLALDHAYVLAAEKDYSGAEKFARQVLDQSQRLGMVRFQLAASLALGQFQANRLGSAKARAMLQALGKTSRKIGFGQIAEQAAVISR